MTRGLKKSPPQHNRFITAAVTLAWRLWWVFAVDKSAQPVARGHTCAAGEHINNPPCLKKQGGLVAAAGEGQRRLPGGGGPGIGRGLPFKAPGRPGPRLGLAVVGQAFHLLFAVAVHAPTLGATAAYAGGRWQWQRQKQLYVVKGKHTAGCFAHGVPRGKVLGCWFSNCSLCPLKALGNTPIKCRGLHNL